MKRILIAFSMAAALVLAGTGPGYAQKEDAAEKEKSNPNTKEAIKHLEEAIKHGKLGHAERVTFNDSGRYSL